MLNLLLPFAGSVISGGLSMLGSKMTSDASAKNARLNAIYQAGQNQMDRDINAANYADASARADNQFNVQRQMQEYQFATQLAEAQKDRELQMEFAKNGVQWRAADARAAGLHPLAAMSAQLSSPSPVHVSGGVPGGSVPSAGTVSSNALSPWGGGGGVGGGLAQMGQDLSRAFSAVATEWERTQGVKTASEALSLENQSLSNQLLAAQIAKTGGAAVGPTMPSTRSTNMISGQGNSPGRINTSLVKEKPHEPVVGHPKQRESEPGEVADVGYARTSTGHTITPSKDVKERIEDDTISELLWHARNRIQQSLFNTKLSPPPHVKLKEGHEWRFNPVTQEYQQKVPLYTRKGGFNFSGWYNSNK